MNTNVVITQDTRRIRKDGTYPIILRLSHHGKTIPISLGIYAKEKDFDLKQRLLKKSYEGVTSITRLNNMITKKKTEVADLITKLEEAGTLHTFTIAELKAKITFLKEGNFFFTYAEKLMKEMKEANLYGNARNYKGVIGVLKTYRKDVDFTFHQLTYEFIKKFEGYYLAKGNSLNGLSVNLRIIRAIYNKAVNEGIVERGLSPFEVYKIKHEQTQKRALSIEGLRKITGLKLKKTDPLFHARNYFIASFFMYGISFIDMAFLRMSNIADGRIKFKRRKTGKPYDLKINAQLEEILSYYTKDKKDDDFIFPIITRASLEQQYNDVENKRKLYNRALKDLAETATIEEHLTSYVSRHSFSTQAMMQGIPLQAISAMLGHSRLSTTEIYLKALPSDVIDEYSAKIAI